MIIAIAKFVIFSQLMSHKNNQYFILLPSLHTKKVLLLPNQKIYMPNQYLFLKIIIPNGKEKCTWGENFFLHFQTSKRTLPEELYEIKNGKWSSKIFLIYIFFLNVGPSKEGIFLTTFYGLYFSHSFF